MAMITPGMKLVIQDSLRESRNSYITINVVSVSTTECTACGYDKFSASGLDATCFNCKGLGLTATFKISKVQARWQAVEMPVLQPFGTVPPGLEGGDCTIWVSRRDFDALNNSRKEDHSYVEISGQTFRLTGYDTDGIMDTEYRFWAKKYKPIFTY